MMTTGGGNSSPHHDARYPPEIRDFYVVKDTLGSGGFAKVRIAMHKVTQQKVAIKIMLKQQLRKTNDLHCAYLEIDALKQLKHQNIARLYQAVETDDAFYLVLEYASGGELFDYIILREKLSEDETRKFFRQIASAVNYCHKHGFVHRDLKPENLLLDENKNIKLIDFGLIGNPKNVDVTLLKTCCGSAAYAAPELIRGEKYIGPPADVWSLGILLYALLCGFLPFDDDNTQKLYRQIQKGLYEIPPWLSTSSQKFIGLMLRHKPEQRISMENLMSHPWILKGLPAGTTSINPDSTLDPPHTAYTNITQEIARYYSVPLRFAEEWIAEWNFDEVTALHELCHMRQQNNDGHKLPAAKGILPEEKRKALAAFKSKRPSASQGSSPLAKTATPTPRRSSSLAQSSPLARAGSSGTLPPSSDGLSSSGSSFTHSEPTPDALTEQLLFQMDAAAPPPISATLATLQDISQAPSPSTTRPHSGSFSTPTRAPGTPPSSKKASPRPQRKSPKGAVGSPPKTPRGRSNTVGAGDLTRLTGLFDRSANLKAQKVGAANPAEFGSLQDLSAGPVSPSSGSSEGEQKNASPMLAKMQASKFSGSSPNIYLPAPPALSAGDRQGSAEFGSMASPPSSPGRPRKGSMFNVFTKSLMNVFGGSNKNLSEPRMVQGVFTANSTTSRPANEIYPELVEVLKSKGCEVREPRKYQVRARFPTGSPTPVTIHFEVCYVPRMEGVVGIHTKRIKGDTWEYQQKVREVLGKMRL